jgi:hypothetical protein
MTHWTHQKRAKYISKKGLKTGMQPRAITGDAGRDTFNHLRAHRQGETYGRQWGRPNGALNGGGVSDFHIISQAITPADTSQTTRKILVQIQHWNTSTYGSGPVRTADHRWNTTSFATAYFFSNSGDSYVTGPTGPLIEHIFDIDVSSPTSGFTSDLLECGGIVAAIGVTTLPEETLTTDAAYGVIPGNTSPGQTIRGEKDNGSVGAMVYYQDAGDSVLANTRRCLFYQMHAAGFYAIGAGAAGYDYIWGGSISANPATLKIKGRNLRGRSAFTQFNTDLAFVCTHDDGAGLRFTSAQTGNIATWTGSGTVTTPTLYVVNDFLRVDPTGDEITVEFYVDSTHAINVNTLSLWEKAGGAEV